MTARVAFVTTELDPFVPGGAGTVVAGLAEHLQAAGYDVVVVLVAHPPADADLPAHVVVAPPGPGLSEAEGPFLAAARAAADAASRLAGSVEQIEFQDFDGLGFWALSHRHDLGLTAVPLMVRMHGPADLLVEGMSTVPAELEPVRLMEREAYAMADAVIVPSAPMARLVEDRYGVEHGRVQIGTPPVPDVIPVEHRPAVHPEFVAYGRLGEVKGSADFLVAALDVAARVDSARFRFVGPDGWHAGAGRSMQDWLEDQIPDGLADRFQFDGRVPREGLGDALATAWAVVVPSRFESFCLAAHEVRRLGKPVLLPDLAAFAPFFSVETGALVYDDLATAMESLAGDPDLVARLAAAPAPETDDPAAPYRRPPPAPRHPQSQAGLATAAVTRLAAAALQPQAGTAARIARSALRALPDPVARLAVRVLPQGVKDRFRRTADWRVEAERRRVDQHRKEFAARVAAGEFPELTKPEVTVVIPCFDHGEFLPDALMSVFFQTLSSWEIVVVDDGSADPATVAYLDGLDLPRTRVIRQDNRGLPAARNAGMAAARGRFLVPLDADDELAPDYLATLHDALEQRPEAAYAHCWAELFGDLEATWVTRPFNPYLLTLSNSVVGCVLLRRAAWAQVGGYDETMRNGNEDWELWIRLLEAGWDQVQVRLPLFRYRRHGISMSTTTEARFEAGRREVAARHPAMYHPAALSRLKAEWYPWVSVIVDPGSQTGLEDQTLDDAEVVPLGHAPAGLQDLCRRRGWPCRPPAADVAAAARAARGKLVTVWDDSPTTADTLAGLAEMMEAETGSMAAADGGVTVWRRWALVDPGSGHTAVIGAALPSGSLTAGCCPDEAWSTGGAATESRVMRQPPEGDGRLPAWVFES